MSSSGRTLLSFLPGEFIGLVIVGLIMAGGLAIMLGMRRKGTALVLSGISLPFLIMIRQTLRYEVLTALPESWRGPISLIGACIFGVVILLAVLRLLLGREIFTQMISQTLGTLLADFLKWLARRITTPLGCLSTLVLLGALYGAITLST